MKKAKILNTKQVARIIASAERFSMNKAMREIEVNGIKKFEYLWKMNNEKIEYIGFNQFKIVEI